MPDRLVNSVGGGSSADARAVLTGRITGVQIDLLAGGKSGELRSDHATGRQNRPIAIGSEKCFTGVPEPRSWGEIRRIDKAGLQV
jgi:hypothetical protein